MSYDAIAAYDAVITRAPEGPECCTEGGALVCALDCDCSCHGAPDPMDGDE